jgi:uncharacterized damage-inducible protein DinB
MNQTEFIADQLQRSFAGEAWHGPAVQELLAGVTAEQALAKPVAGAHSIWELAMHIGVWMSAARRRLAGDPAEATPQQDWPAIDGRSPAAWQQTLDALELEHQQLQAAICGLPENALQNRVAGNKYSVAFLLHGVIQHNLYHAGQIAVLKKAL